MTEIYAMGGYGTGNLGDEAIFLGLQKQFPEVIQIYTNLPQFSNNIWYGRIKEEGFPTSARGGELIIGGGGIFHSKQAIMDFLTVAEKSRQRDMKVSIRRVGAEYLSDDFKEEAKELCNIAHFISVRSKRSVEILRSIGFDPRPGRDYTYVLSKEDFQKIPAEFPEFPKFPEYILGTNAKTIGLITGGNKDNLDKIASLIKFLISDFGAGPTKCNVVFIPHSRHYTDYATNDVVTGEMLWSMIDIYHSDRADRFKIMKFPKTVYELLNAYTKVDAIIGFRYHSFIFSEILQKPLLGLVSGPKATAYFEEINGGRWIDIGEPIDKLVLKIWDFIRLFKGIGNQSDEERNMLASIVDEVTRV